MLSRFQRAACLDAMELFAFATFPAPLGRMLGVCNPAEMSRQLSAPPAQGKSRGNLPQIHEIKQMPANSPLSFLFLCSPICCMHQHAACNLFPAVAAPQPGVGQNKATRNRQPGGSVALLEGHVNSSPVSNPTPAVLRHPSLSCLNYCTRIFRIDSLSGRPGSSTSQT